MNLLNIFEKNKKVETWGPWTEIYACNDCRARAHGNRYKFLCAECGGKSTRKTVARLITPVKGSPFWREHRGSSTKPLTQLEKKLLKAFISMCRSKSHLGLRAILDNTLSGEVNDIISRQGREINES